MYGLQCVWQITVPIGYTVDAAVVSLDAGSSEYLSFYDGITTSSSSLAQLSGSDIDSVRSSGNTMSLTFTSYSFLQYRGWSLALIPIAGRSLVVHFLSLFLSFLTSFVATCIDLLFLSYFALSSRSFSVFH